MAWIGPVVGALGGIFSGLIQKKQAREASLALPQAQSYAPTPQMIEAEKMLSDRSKFGMSDAELALANQQMARSRATGERSLFNMGLSRLSQGVSNIYGMDAAMQLNALNAQQKENAQRAYAGMASQFQGIKDREVASFNQMLQQSRTALGQASASGSKNILAGIGTFAQGMNTNRLAAAYEKSGDTYNFGTGDGGVGGGDGGFGRQGVDGGIATAPGVAQPMTFEGSGTPFLPAADQPSSVFSPIQQPAQQQTPNVFDGGEAYNPESFFQTGTQQIETNPYNTGTFEWQQWEATH